jgi:MAF protein
MKIILASSSVYRKELLQRLNLKFSCQSPDIDEKLDNSCSFEQNAMVISTRKAQRVSKFHPKALIIASDQLCVLNEQVMSKPGGFDKAYQQLKLASGHQFVFYTGLCVYIPSNKEYITYCDKTTAVFRKLKDQEIKDYLNHDQPYDCAGSFKVESLGISLFKKIINQDPTALMGLPLIKLSEILRGNAINLSQE